MPPRRERPTPREGTSRCRRSSCSARRRVEPAGARADPDRRRPGPAGGRHVPPATGDDGQRLRHLHRGRGGAPRWWHRRACGRTSPAAEARPRLAVADAVVVDGFSVFFTVVICIAVVLGALLADGYLRRERLEAPTFYVLMMLSASGGILMAKANDLIVVFLGLEILSIALYVLAGYHQPPGAVAGGGHQVLRAGRRSPRPSSSTASPSPTAPPGRPTSAIIAEFLRAPDRHRRACSSAARPPARRASGSRWRPCRSTCGRPTSTRARPRRSPASWPRRPRRPASPPCCASSSPPSAPSRLDWQPIVWVLAVLSLVVGSVLAVVQTDVKRMLAYSSISHAGYVLIGLQAATDRGIAGSLFYLLAYTFMILGSFAIVTIVGRRGDARHGLDAYRGLARDRPGAGLRLHRLPPGPGRRAVHVRVPGQVLRDLRRGRGPLLRPRHHRHAGRRSSPPSSTCA